jgi:S1-C subfamily serine protease
MFCTKIISAMAFLLAMCVLANGVSHPAGPPTALGQTPAKEKESPGSPAQKTNAPQQSPSAKPMDDGLSPAFARAAKAATALLEIDGRKGTHSAFCIHTSGLFLTNAHVIQGDIDLVLNPGQESEKAYATRVIRKDNDQDLALLQVEGGRDLPALTLGADVSLEELMTVWAFGYPLRTLAAQQAREYPGFCATQASIRSLPLRDSRVPRIELNATLDAGDSGGPLLDRSGKVIGVVVAGVGGNVAIPASAVAAFLARPEVEFDPPLLEPSSFHKPVRFEARVVPVVPVKTPLAVDLVLQPSNGKERTYHMKAVGDSYHITAAPVPTPGPLTVRLLGQFTDGTLDVTATDFALKAGDREVKLSDVRRINLGATQQVLLHDGKEIHGTVSGLEGVPVRLGKQKLTVDLGKAAEVTCTPATASGQVSCTLIVKQGDKEVLRQQQSVTDRGLIKNPGFEARFEGWKLFNGAPPATNAGFQLDQDVLREGAQSLRVSFATPADIGCEQEVVLKPGQWYRFSGWVRTRGLISQGASVHGTFHILGRDLGAKGTNHQGDTEWTEVRIPFQAPTDGLIRITAQLAGWGRGAGTVWFDDLRLVEISPPPR